MALRDDSDANISALTGKQLHQLFSIWDMMDLSLISSTSEEHCVKVSAKNHGTVNDTGTFLGTFVSHVMLDIKMGEKSRTSWIGYGLKELTMSAKLQLHMMEAPCVFNLR